MAQARAAAGFTLIEVVIALAVVAITTTIAAATYRNHLRRSHRAEAVYALLLAATEQEKFHLAHGSYGNRLDAAVGDDPPGLPVASRTPGGHYALAVATATAAEFRVVATDRVADEILEFLRRTPHTPNRGTLVGRTVLEKRAIHLPDVRADREYKLSEAIRLMKLRTSLGVPLLREGEPIGAISLHRTEVRPFSDREIELVTTICPEPCPIIAGSAARMARKTLETLTVIISSQRAGSPSATSPGT